MSYLYVQSFKTQLPFFLFVIITFCETAKIFPLLKHQNLSTIKNSDSLLLNILQTVIITFYRLYFLLPNCKPFFIFQGNKKTSANVENILRTFIRLKKRFDFSKSKSSNCFICFAVSAFLLPLIGKKLICPRNHR